MVRGLGFGVCTPTPQAVAHAQGEGLMGDSVGLGFGDEGVHTHSTDRTNFFQREAYSISTRFFSGRVLWYSYIETGVAKITAEMVNGEVSNQNFVSFFLNGLKDSETLF